MKKRVVLLIGLMLLGIGLASCGPVIPAEAAAQGTTVQVTTLTELQELALNLTGVTAFIVMLANLLGFLGLFKQEGSKGAAATAFQLLVLIGLWIAKTFFPDFDLSILDAYAQGLADLGIAVLAAIPTVLGLAGLFHRSMAGVVPVAGFSNSAGDKTLPEVVSAVSTKKK